MKGLKPWLVIGLVFFAGIAVGVLGARKHWFDHVAVNPKNPTERVDFMRDRMEKEMVSGLDLTPEQQTNIHQIFIESGEQMRKVHNEFEPRIKEIFEKAHTNIAARLTAEQREKFEKFTKERRERFDKFRGDKDFGPSHHGKHPSPPEKP